MAVPRLSSVVMSLSLALSLLLCFLSLQVQSQSYVPQPAPFTQCPPGQQIITLGSMDLTNTTLFPDNDGDSILYANPYYPYIYVTPFTLRGQNAFGTVIYQLAMNVFDMSYWLLQPAKIRLALYLYQEAEKTAFPFDLGALIAQTDEITLYPSGAQIVYANLMQPVVLDSEGDYGIAIYTDSSLIIAGGAWGTGVFGAGQFPDMYNYIYNDYSAPEGVELDGQDKARPVTATGCLDTAQFKQPNTTYYAFCALVETYKRQPANNTNPLITSLTNVTRYSGVIAVRNNITVKTDYGTGYPITYMEGEVQLSTNAGALVYPPLGLRANPFYYRSAKSSIFPGASDLLYPDMAIPLDKSGIIITTARNQTNLFYTNVSIDSTIGQRDESGVTKTFFSSFDLFPAFDLEQVITACNVPPGYDYVPDNFQCDSDSAPVSFGDVDLNDLDPIEEDFYADRLPPNLISFRFFIPWTPDTTIYQLQYYTWANPVAIVHMRLGLFTTNTSYVDSFSALPQYQLLEETEEVELVNVDNTMVIATLKRPVRLTQNKTYAIGVWADSLLYGPQAQWGVDAAGAPLPYNLIDIDGQFPKQILALGGQTGTQPMAAVGCVAKQQLLTFEWCATFADYFEIFGQWYLDRRFYSGTFWGLSTPYTNSWGTYHILTAGNGTFWEIVTPVPPPPSGHEAWAKRGSQVNGTTLSGKRLGLGDRQNVTAVWNLNNFQVQSQDFLYVSHPNNMMFDGNGIQIIINIEFENYEEIYATIIKSVKPRGSPTLFYQENVEYTYMDEYIPLFNSGVEMHLVRGSQDPIPSCPLVYVPWDLVFIGIVEYTYPLLPVCVGQAQMMSTYGDNRIAEYSDDTEGHVVKGGVVYTYNFTAKAGNYLQQVSIDVLNNTMLDQWVTAYMGIYAGNGTLITEAIPIQMLETLDQMVVSDLTPIFLTEDGLYYVAIMFDHDYFVASGVGSGYSMTYSGEGLPDTFQPDGISRTPPIAAYGCVTASHYFCGSFQYYQGDDYSPVAVDYLYQGLLLAGGTNGTNSQGFWQSILLGVGHLFRYVRIARFGNNFLQMWTDILLSQPGNATSNYIYVSNSQTGATLDDIGLTFLTDDEFGYPLTISYNATTGEYVDSTDVQLGVELLNTFVIAPINMSIGVPQCSVLDLEFYVSPSSSLNTTSFCPRTQTAVRWGSADPLDYFYQEEGLFTNYYTDITLSPFNTGLTYSNVTQLAITLGQNANVFAHMRMALYLNNTLLAESNEVTVDNPQDVTLFFTLNQTVTLFPASQYYIAMWTDVTLYMAAAWDYSGLCYYGITYGYDLQPWPGTIGSVEALYAPCHSIPVAALGCAVPTGPPYIAPVDPNCPVVNGTGSSPVDPEVQTLGFTAAHMAVGISASAVLTALASLFVGWLIVSGKCGGCVKPAAVMNAGRYQKDATSSTAILTSDSSSDYAAM